MIPTPGTCTFCGTSTPDPEMFNVCEACYEWTPDADPGHVLRLAQDPRDLRATCLPDTPPLGVLGSALLTGFVALAMIGRAAELLPSPRAILYVARHAHLRRFPR